jgi:hypothetical protein
MTAVTLPESAPPVSNPPPELRVAFAHAYEIAIDIPTSAIFGWHEIVATGVFEFVVPPVPVSVLLPLPLLPLPPVCAPFGMHCHPPMQPLPLVVAFHVPLVQLS